jgi:NADH:ubiquinone oxidoreductase subunit 6 (subunit J)
MSGTRKPASPARTLLNVCWILAIGWIVFAGLGGALTQPMLTVLGFVCFVGAVVTLIVGLVLRSKERAASSPPAQ